MTNTDRCFDLLGKNDFDGLRRLLESDPSCAEGRDPNGVSLLMHSLYRGRRDIAELIAARKQTQDIFEATSLGRLGRLRELAKDPAAINSYSADGFTALHFACFFEPARIRPTANRIRGRRGRRRRQSDGRYAPALGRLGPQLGSCPSATRARSPRHC